MAASLRFGADRRGGALEVLFGGKIQEQARSRSFCKRVRGLCLARVPTDILRRVMTGDASSALNPGGRMDPSSGRARAYCSRRKPDRCRRRLLPSAFAVCYEVLYSTI